MTTDETKNAQIYFRKLWAADTSALKAHLLRLDPESRRTRFGTPVGDYFIEQYAENALGNHSIAHGYFVDGILLAMEKEAAIGEIFNMRDERLVTREEFIHTVCDYLGAPHPKHVPEWLARLAVRPIERIARPVLGFWNSASKSASIVSALYV